MAYRCAESRGFSARTKRCLVARTQIIHFLSPISLFLSVLSSTSSPCKSEMVERYIFKIIGAVKSREEYLTLELAGFPKVNNHLGKKP